MSVVRIDPEVLPGDAERTMLRDALRTFLEDNWAAGGAVALGSDPIAIASVWEQLAVQGLASLGSDPSEGGLREIALVMEELGRAACPVPMLGASLANLLLARHDEPAAVALLSGLRTGSIRLALALGSFEPERGATAGRAEEPPREVKLAFVDGGLGATHVLARSETGTELLLACLQDPGSDSRSTRALGADAWTEVRLDETKATRIVLDRSQARDARLIVRTALTARAYGAAQRAFELAVDHAKHRQQFGQPIGRFQAIQHKLANNQIALEGVRVGLAYATAAYDLQQDAWPYLASAAAAYACEALRTVSLETQHALGAVGYADEHEAPRHFKRVHLDTIVVGGALAARAELARALLDSPRSDLPEYDLGSAGNAFRQEVRAWLSRHWTPERAAEFERRPFGEREYDESFARDLGKTGWLGMSWPIEQGGQGRTAREQIALLEEIERAQAPSRFGAAVQAQALLLHGTPDQQARYLPEILQGRAMHGMGYSEPGAGSDLASLKTTATLEGDEWVIRGQKIWTTTWWGQYMFLAARTDKDARPPHAGISMFIVPMNTPGITIRPAVTMYDGSFANIFYDDVRIPKDALIGPENGGWRVLMDALATERGLVGGGIAIKVAHLFESLCDDLRRHPTRCSDSLVRDRIGRLAAEIEVARQLMIGCAERAEHGPIPAEMAAISKVFSGELMERLGESVLDLLGPQAALSQDAPGAMRNGLYEQGLRHSLMWVISIGTNEIQRSLIAQRGLGLPR